MRAFYGLNDRIGAGTAALCGLQHVLAMFVGIITPPLIVSHALGLDHELTGYLISMALFTSGLTSWIQIRRIGPVGSGMLSVQGTSFSFVQVAQQTGAAGGLPLIFGMTIAAAPLEMALSRCIGAARKLFPPVVTGSVVMLIGLDLIRVGFTDMAGGFGAPDFGALRHFSLGGFVLVMIVIFNRFGRGLASTVSIALGLICGYLLAAALGRVDFSPVVDANWASLPAPLKLGIAFDARFLIPWLILYFVTTLESIGDLTATSGVSREPVSGPLFIERLKGGTLADGLNSVIAGLFGSMPNTTFSQNNGVIALTGVASRRAGYAAAALLVLLGLFPKLAALISIMPKPVLGGATVVMFAMVAVAGLRIVHSGGISVRSEFILAITLALGLGVTLVPGALRGLETMQSGTALMQNLIGVLNVIAHSGLTVGALTASLLNAVLPEDSDTPVDP